jgi:hypothetical protein
MTDRDVRMGHIAPVQLVRVQPPTHTLAFSPMRPARFLFMMSANDATEHSKPNETQPPMSFSPAAAAGPKNAQVWLRYICCAVIFLLCTTEYLYGTSGYTIDVLPFRSIHALRHRGLDCPKYTVCVRSYSFHSPCNRRYTQGILDCVSPTTLNWPASTAVHVTQG